MAGTEDGRNHASMLRQRAEEALRGRRVEVSDLPPEDIQYLLHELQVHQTELAIQNDELRGIHLELEAARDLYSDLYNNAPAGYCTISRSNQILEANHTLAIMLEVKREDLIHSKLSDYVDRDSQDEFYLYHQGAIEDRQRHISTIRMVKRTGVKIDVRLESAPAPENKNDLRVMLSDITQQLRNEKEALETASFRELQHRLADQREKERLQVSRDLHDGPLQGLIGISIGVSEMLMDHPHSELGPQLVAIQTELKTQIGALRAFATEQRPPLLSRFGLERTIVSHAETFQEKHPGVRINLSLCQNNLQLEEMTSLALFRIYQEALVNIIKHVRRTDTRVNVRLDQNDHQVQLIIQDNGQGFKQPEQWVDLVREGHLGLLGMRERAEAIGGLLEIQSNPGEGTIVIATVPLK